MPVSLIIAIIFVVVSGLVALEIISLTGRADKLVYACDVNMSLCEPDELVTLTFRVRNASLLPVMYAGFSVLFDDVIEVRESDEWLAKHSQGGLFGNMFSFDFFLLPHRTFRGSIRFSVKERGLHRIGRVYIERGDFMGFKSRVRSFDISKQMICTARPCEDEPEIKALGGFLGDISVRRFICEDPSLVLGFREYTGSEPLKSISWTQTAKTGALMVKKHDFTVDTDVAVVMDIKFTERPVAERCLSLLRTVCDALESARIPYAVYSNGDIFEIEKGGGRTHNFAVQLRIGLSRFVKYSSLPDLVSHVASSGGSKRGCIFITPKLEPETSACIAMLDASSGAPTFVLTGELPEPEAPEKEGEAA